jgi:hypothetical protein
MRVVLPVTSSVDERLSVEPVMAPRVETVEYSVVAVSADEEAVVSVV